MILCKLNAESSSYTSSLSTYRISQVSDSNGEVVLRGVDNHTQPYGCAERISVVVARSLTSMHLRDLLWKMDPLWRYPERRVSVEVKGIEIYQRAHAYEQALGG